MRNGSTRSDASGICPIRAKADLFVLGATTSVIGGAVEKRDRSGSRLPFRSFDRKAAARGEST